MPRLFNPSMTASTLPLSYRLCSLYQRSNVTPKSFRSRRIPSKIRSEAKRAQTSTVITSYSIHYTKLYEIVGIEELYARVDETYHEIEALKGIPIDTVFICSKAIDLPAVSRSLEELGLTDTNFVSYQNGIDNEQA